MAMIKRGWGRGMVGEEERRKAKEEKNQKKSKRFFFYTHREKPTKYIEGFMYYVMLGKG